LVTFATQITALSKIILSPFRGNPKLKLIFVMILFPLFFNTLSFILTDNIIKSEKILQDYSIFLEPLTLKEYNDRENENRNGNRNGNQNNNNYHLEENQLKESKNDKRNNNILDVNYNKSNKEKGILKTYIIHDILLLENNNEYNNHNNEYNLCECKSNTDNNNNKICNCIPNRKNDLNIKSDNINSNYNENKNITLNNKKTEKQKEKENEKNEFDSCFNYDYKKNENNNDNKKLDSDVKDKLQKSK
jgi:phosphatidate phosphatase LPIN